MIDLASKARSNGRISDISAGGCFIDTQAIFPSGTAVKLAAMRENGSFEAKARVVYSQPNIGMGLQFSTIEPHHLSTLNKWLAQLSTGVDEVTSMLTSAMVGSKHSHSEQTSTALTELVLLLMRKRIINDVEGKTILRSLLG